MKAEGEVSGGGEKKEVEGVGVGEGTQEMPKKKRKEATSRRIKYDDAALER